MSDGIITRLLEWLGAIIGRRKPDQPVAPLFKTIEELRWDNGLLRRVEVDKAVRPNEVLTYLFIPFRKSGGVVGPDLLVTCSQLEGRGQRLVMTHQISVLAVPHFARDLDSVQIAYSEPWDLQGRSPYRDSYVRCILFRVAAELRRSPPELIDWRGAIATARAECWGGLPVPKAPSLPGGDIWVEPYDQGTRRVRVRFKTAWLWLAYLLWEG